jgi:hypothetical protein
MTHPIAMMKTCMAALLFVAALLLAQGEPASAAPYNGDIGETRFTSLDRWGNQSTFILKRYAKPNGGNGGGVVLVTPEPEQGTYEIVDPTQEAGRWNRSFDYDPKSGVLTLYDDGGPTERWTFLPWKGWEPGDVKVEQLIPENRAYDAVYEWQESRSAYVAYIPGIGERTLPEYILNVQGAFNMMKEDLDQGKEWELQGDAYGEFISFVVRKTKKQASAPQASPAVPARYMVVDANDSSEWVSFSYDTATGIFTMYSDSENGADEPYAYRRFLSDGRLESKGIDGAVPTAIYTRDGSGKYDAGSGGIYRYVTDGMRLFLQKIR